MTETGIYPDMPDEEYQAQPALSATGMRHLLRSPLHYRHRMDNRKDTPEFDFGHAVHAKILGVGAAMVAIPEAVLSKSGSIGTNAAREFIEGARADHLIPLKADVIAEVDAVVEAVLRNKKAARLLSLPGASEISLFAVDPETGVEIRGRLDRLTHSHVPIDVKTTTSVQRHKLRRAIESFGYDIQSEAYRHLIRLVMKIEPGPTQLIFVESDPPHEVRVVQLSHPDWIKGGQAQMRAALAIYAECIATDTWPGEDDLDPDVEALDPNPWYATEHIPEMEMVI